jgi:uncharacterized protein YcaQ
MRTVPVEAVSALFLRRQHLDRPFSLPFGRKAVTRFIEDAGGLQLDSINVVERAHYLTLWSRFGPYDKAALDRLVYRDRALVEYWSHAACLVAASDLGGWRRAMADLTRGDTGWGNWLRAERPLLRRVESAVRRRGPLSAAAFERPSSMGKREGWWDWKPAHHALHYLWLSGRVAVHSRRNFEKRYDLADRVLPPGEPIGRAEFPRWHLRKTLRALGAASEQDLPRYMTFPRLGPRRRQALARMLASGEAVELKVEGRPGRWFALSEDLRALESPPRPSGTTLLCPFDSLLWHRGRAKALFGFDYRIEVYTPAARRVYGYYTLPILHDGRLIGRLDPKNHRERGLLEVRAVHFHSEPAAEAVEGTARAVRSLAEFVGAREIAAPPGPLGEALRLPRDSHVVR